MYMFVYIYISSRIFENVTAKWNFCVQQFFSAKKVTLTKKLRVQPLPFFLLLLSSSSLFLFLLSFSFFSVILELIGPKKPAFWSLFTQMTVIFARLVFKKSATIYIWKFIQRRERIYSTKSLSGLSVVQLFCEEEIAEVLPEKQSKNGKNTTRRWRMLFKEYLVG